MGLQGAYQEENAALALQAFLLFMKQMGWEIDFSLLPSSLRKTHWAGRLEEIRPNIYLDGAHNLPALARLVEFIKGQKGKTCSLLFGALKRKDYSGMLAYLQEALPEVQVTVTSFDYGESVGQAEAADFEYVADYRAFIENFKQKQTADQVLFVTGSLYFIAEVRAYFQSV